MIRKLASALLVTLAATAGASAFAAPVNVSIRVGPPAPRYEAVPAPRPGYVWAPGYWDWRSNRHYWVPGNWVGARSGYVYTQPTWVNEGNNWRLYRGAWARPYGDRDRDGIPNRYDRDRDNDGVRNRNDRDRDGDGIRNRNDRHPNNPNRR